MRRRQLGFLLNPYRHQGSTVGKGFSMTAESTVTFAGAGIAEATASSAGEAMLFGDSATESGAMSVAAESVVTLRGAAIAEAVASAGGESTATLFGTSGSIVCDAADFDGSNDLLVRNAALSGVEDSKKGILSFWVKQDASSATYPLAGFVQGDSLFAVQFILNQAITGAFRIFLTDAEGNTNLDVSSTVPVGTGSWAHVLASWDLSASEVHIYIDDNDRTGSPSTLNDDTVAYEADKWTVGAHPSTSGNKADGGFAELYFAPGQYLDFSVEENRRKFVTDGLEPADLGATGVNPTGTEPAIYLHLDDGEAANNFAINRGTGGNFSVTGELSTYPTSPSD